MLSHTIIFYTTTLPFVPSYFLPLLTSILFYYFIFNAYTLNLC
jgi:hypothetical protein